MEGDTGAILHIEEEPEQVKCSSIQIEKLICRAVVDLVSGGDSGVTGRLHVVQGYGAVHIGGKIHGLKPGLHGFHVHMTGDIGDNCKAAGGHFNPDGVKLKTSLSQNTCHGYLNF